MACVQRGKSDNQISVLNRSHSLSENNDEPLTTCLLIIRDFSCPRLINKIHCKKAVYKFLHVFPIMFIDDIKNSSTFCKKK
jgi:hypothetical protein